MQLQRIAEAVWIYAGSSVSFYGFPFPTCMSVIRLPGDRLWIHSPEKLNGDLQAELSILGKVSYLISPNKLHHLFLDEWLAAYPDAMSYAAPGLIEKRRDLRFDAELSDQAEVAWAEEIAQERGYKSRERSEHPNSKFITKNLKHSKPSAWVIRNVFD